jgi:hypothetical protein
MSMFSPRTAFPNDTEIEYCLKLYPYEVQIPGQDSRVSSTYWMQSIVLWGYVAAMNVESFNRNTRTQDAVIRSTQIIGEATNKVRTADPEFAAQHRRFRGRQCTGRVTE